MPIEAIKAVAQSKDAYIISSVLLNFWTHKIHLEKIISLTGMGCCADKAKAILNQYVYFLKTGVKPEWKPDEPNCFWLPKFGTQDQWFNFIEPLRGNHISLGGGGNGGFFKI